MDLYLQKGWEGEEELISKRPTNQLIVELISSLDWSQFNSVSLKVNKDNWINVSGNISEDGLAIVYVENGEIEVSDIAPDSTNILIESLKSYLNQDEGFKNRYIISIKQQDLKQKLKENELRRIQFEAQSKSEKRYHLISLVGAVLFFSLIAIILYLWYKDELKFIGHETDYTTANVIETSPRAVRGGYIQIVIFRYEIDGKAYEGYFNGSKITGKHEVGDLIKIKYATDEPDISRRVATFKRNH